MLRERTFNVNQNKGADESDGLVTIAAFGAEEKVEPGKTVSETLAELKLDPQPYQSVRVGGREIEDIGRERTKTGDIVTVTNTIEGG